MNGRFACLIVIASVFVTGFTGYLANADVETDERQVYDYSANLVPSVVSSDVEQYSQYNPSDNVTGWNRTTAIGEESNAKIPTTNTASPYIITSRVTGYTERSIDVTDIAYYTQPDNGDDWVYPSASWGGGEVYVRTSVIDGENYFEGYVYFARESNEIVPYLVYDVIDPTDDVTESDIISGGYFVGGRSTSGSYTTAGTTRITYDHNLDAKVLDTVGTTVWASSGSVPLYVMPFESISQYQENIFQSRYVLDLSGCRVISTNSAEDIGWITLAHTAPSTHHHIYHYTWGAKNATIIYDGTQNDVGLIYNKDTNSWYKAQKNANGIWYQTDNVQYPLDRLALVTSVGSPNPFDDPPQEFVYDEPTVIPATYADNTRMTQIGVLDTDTFGTTAMWQNNNNNGTITFLAKLNADTGNLQITTKTRTTVGGVETYSLNGSWMAYTSANGGPVTSTGYVLITLDIINGSYTYTPVTSIEYVTVRENNTDVQYANPQTFQTGGYAQNLATVQSPSGTDMVVLELTYSNTVGEAYVVNTVVQLDPERRLWSDPSLYLGVYFPESFEPTDTSRVWFNAFVAVGSAVIINGQTYQVTDGQITVGDTKVDLKGMAVDWAQDNNNVVHVYVAPGGDDFRKIDLGPVDITQIAVQLKVGGTEQTVTTTVGYVIGMTGIWYYEVGLYNGHTEQYDKLDLNLTKGWGLSFAGACLLFCGCLILLTAVGTYYLKDNGPDFTDWLIIVIAIVITIAIAGLMG